MPKSNGTPAAAEREEFEFFAGDETITIYLDDDSRHNDPTKRVWVRLLKELDYGQQSELDGAGLRGVTMADAQDAAEHGQLIVFNLAHQRRLKLSLYIDDWSLPHRWPAPLALRYQLVKRLKPLWATLIMEQIERLEKEAAGDIPEQAVESDPNVMSLPSRALEPGAT